MFVVRDTLSIMSTVRRKGCFNRACWQGNRCHKARRRFLQRRIIFEHHNIQCTPTYCRINCANDHSGVCRYSCSHWSRWLVLLLSAKSSRRHFCSCCRRLTWRSTSLPSVAGTSRKRAAPYLKTCVPGMARYFMGASPMARFTQSRRQGEGQGCRCETASGGSPIRNGGAMNKNRIRGVMHSGRAGT